MVKRSLAILLALLLTFSNVALGANLGNLEKPVRENQEVPTTATILQEEIEETYAPDEKVRVVVELKEKAPIQVATEKGVKFTELSETEQDSLIQKALDSQETAKQNISLQKVQITYIENFTTVMNGFSAEVEYGYIPLLEQVDNVANVYIVNEYQRPDAKPEMAYSKELVQAQKAWQAYGYKGEGMVVGIIDTGIDPNHRDMVISEGTEVALTEDFVNEVKADKDLPGIYFTEKVPYGYNYMDKNTEVLDLGPDASHHGMHVGGTVAANGDEENGGLQGIAPEAQLLALKVFGNDPGQASTWGDIYVKAIDDAIALGVDVLNLSLGSTASFVRPEDPEQKAIKRAVENGVLMAISAGNSAHFGNGFANPYPSNPDIGVVGSPGLTHESLQVASLENSFIKLSAANVAYDGEEVGLLPYQSASSVAPESIEAKPYELVWANLGGVEDFEGIDVEGKFALIIRGTHTFVDKTLNAQKAGAAGVIIYNNAGGYINMASDPAITIPQLGMLKTDGDALVAKLKAGVNVTVEFQGETTAAPNPNSGKMSDFTSWGLTPSLDFKPEITAPGGQILSTLQNNQYGLMSGTSMAAPHVAGGAAVVLQRVDEEFTLTGAERVNLAKSLLMNTAVPQLDKGFVNGALGWNTPFSPRRQGAGLMDIHAALSTPVIVTESSTNEAKVALKEVTETFDFTLTLENFSDEPVTYNVGANVQTNFSSYGELGWDPNDLEAQPLVGAIITIDGTEDSAVEVPANSKIDVSVAVDLSEALVVELSNGRYLSPDVAFPNGYFVEGFVTFTDVSDNNPELSVPYVGFKGEWDKAPIVDPVRWDAESFYRMTSLGGVMNGTLYQLGVLPGEYEEPTIGFSPNNDGHLDYVVPILSFLRNAKHVEYNVLDSDKNHLRTIRKENDVRKNYYDGGRAQTYSLVNARQWNGKVNNVVVEDGLYYYEVKSVIDYPDAKWQSFLFPVFVDATAPELTGVTIDKDTNTLSWNASDAGTGIAYTEVYVDGQLRTTITNPEVTEFALATPYQNIEQVLVKVYDHVGNVAVEYIDELIPYVFVTTPSVLSAYSTLEIPVEGYVTDRSGVAQLLVNGEEVELVLEQATGRYHFNTTVTFEADGYHEVEFTAVDNQGNEISILRRFFVDTQAPELTVDAPATVGVNTEKATLKVNVKDNFDEIRVSINDSEEYVKGLNAPYEMRALDLELELEVDVKVGTNTYYVTATDLAGNVTTKEVTIQRTDVDPVDPVDPVTPPTPPANPNPAPPVVVDPGKNVEGVGTVKEENNSFVVNVSANAVANQVNNADATNVVLDLSKDVKLDGKSLNAVLSKDLTKQIQEKQKGLVVKVEGASVQLDAASLETVNNSAGNEVKLSIAKAENSKAPASTTLVGAPYSITVTSGDSKVTNFDGNVTIQLPVAGVKDARKVAAYYFNGDAWTYEGGKVVDGTLTFAVNHLSTFAAFEGNVTFADIAKFWAKDEIEVLASRSIIKGKDNGNFGGNDNITRAQFATLLTRALNLPTAEFEGVFKDVTAAHTSSNLEIEAAYRAGIVTGGQDGNFRPYENITREQMAAMIVRAIEYKNAELLSDAADVDFLDASKISSYAKTAVAQAAALDVLKGRENGTFGPKDNATRAQAASVLYRMLVKLGEF